MDYSARMGKQGIRALGQTSTSFSCSQELLDRIDRMRAGMGLDRSNFVRFCITRYLAEQDELRATKAQRAAESRDEYRVEPRQKKV